MDVAFAQWELALKQSVHQIGGHFFQKWPPFPFFLRSGGMTDVKDEVLSRSLLFQGYDYCFSFSLFFFFLAFSSILRKRIKVKWQQNINHVTPDS